MTSDGSLRLQVRVRTGSRESGFLELLSDGSFRIALKSPPVDGRANDELVRLLAGEFGTGRSSVKILTGATSRRKLVRVNGATRSPDWFNG